jgi:uncharacterized RDD family membrane protein YckC
MTTVRLAGFATRALGLLIDFAILDAATLATGPAITWAAGLLGVQFSPSAPVVSVYLVTFWILTGQTPGMRFMGIRVTDLRGGRPGLVSSLRRLAGIYPAALLGGAGFLLVLVDDRRRGLHEHVAGTLVIHDARRRPAVDHLHRMMPPRGA